jgi:hypothetical protein
MPHSRGRVSIIMDTGQPAYVRDGVKIKHGFLGGGVLDAVRGHPQAEAAAREYKSRIGWGALLGLGGVACIVATTISLGVRADEVDRSNDVPPELWASLGCAVVTFIGLGYAVSAEPYRWDAINIFNDAYNPGPVPMPAPGPYYPGTAPAPGGPPGGPGALLDSPHDPVSLRMRD